MVDEVSCDRDDELTHRCFPVFWKNMSMESDLKMDHIFVSAIKLNTAQLENEMELMIQKQRRSRKQNKKLTKENENLIQQLNEKGVVIDGLVSKERICVQDGTMSNGESRLLKKLQVEEKHCHQLGTNNASLGRDAYLMGEIKDLSSTLMQDKEKMLQLLQFEQKVETLMLRKLEQNCEQAEKEVIKLKADIQMMNEQRDEVSHELACTMAKLANEEQHRSKMKRKWSRKFIRPKMFQK